MHVSVKSIKIIPMKKNSIISKLKSFYFKYTYEGHASDQFSFVAVAKRYAILGKDPKSVFGASARINKDGVAQELWYDT